MKKYLLILVTSLGLVSCVGNGSPNMAVNKFDTMDIIILYSKKEF